MYGQRGCCEQQQFIRAHGRTHLLRYVVPWVAVDNVAISSIPRRKRTIGARIVQHASCSAVDFRGLNRVDRLTGLEEDLHLRQTGGDLLRVSRNE